MLVQFVILFNSEKFITVTWGNRVEKLSEVSDVSSFMRLEVGGYEILQILPELRKNERNTKFIWAFPRKVLGKVGKRILVVIKVLYPSWKLMYLSWVHVYPSWKHVYPSWKHKIYSVVKK